MEDKIEFLLIRNIHKIGKTFVYTCQKCRVDLFKYDQYEFGEISYIHLRNQKNFIKKTKGEVVLKNNIFTGKKLNEVK